MSAKAPRDLRPIARWTRAAIDAVPDVASAVAICLLFAAETVDPARRESMFVFVYVDPGLQFVTAILIALALYLRAWPTWIVATASIAAAAIGLGPLIARIVATIPPAYYGDAALAAAWMFVARGFNAWRRFPDVRDAFDDGRLFAALMLPPLQSFVALGTAIGIALVVVIGFGRDPEVAHPDGYRVVALAYFATRALLYVPPLQRALSGRIGRTRQR